MNTWIQLKLKRTSPKIKLIAHLVGESDWVVFGKVIDWLQYIDAHFDQEATILDRDLFNLQFELPDPIEGKVDYFTALSDPRINWIQVNDEGMICVVDYEGNFSKSAKRRIADAKRKASDSASQRKSFRNDAENIPQPCGKNAEQNANDSASQRKSFRTDSENTPQPCGKNAELKKRREENKKINKKSDVGGGDVEELLSELGVNPIAFSKIKIENLDTDKVLRYWITQEPSKKPLGVLVNTLKACDVPPRQPTPQEVVQRAYKQGLISEIELESRVIQCRGKPAKYNAGALYIGDDEISNDQIKIARLIFKPKT